MSPEFVPGETRDTTLADAIEEAQRKARDDERWAAHLQLHELSAKLRYEDVQLRWEVHKKSHDEQDASVVVALDAVVRAGKDHAIAHTAAHDAHSREHTLVDRSIFDHGTAHEREHAIHSVAHDREHVAQEHAVSKVEQTTEKRFEGVNMFREQLREQAGTFASSERVATMQKDLDRRLEEHRIAITNLEKGDVGQQGRALGQGAAVAIIVGAISLVGTILGILVVAANVLSSAP